MKKRTASNRAPDYVGPGSYLNLAVDKQRLQDDWDHTIQGRSELRVQMEKALEEARRLRGDVEALNASNERWRERNEEQLSENEKLKQSSHLEVRLANEEATRLRVELAELQQYNGRLSARLRAIALALAGP